MDVDDCLAALLVAATVSPSLARFRLDHLPHKRTVFGFISVMRPAAASAVLAVHPVLRALAGHAAILDGLGLVLEL
jgi:hypothetical protein